MITVAEASARILTHIRPLAHEAVTTGKAVGRVLAAPVTAPVDSPPWDNSSMDGYAIRSSDVRTTASELRGVGEGAAGNFPSREIGTGESMIVWTGAPVPAGADTVIRREDTDNGREKVTVNDLRDLGKNIRKRGEDFRSGDLLFDAGEEIRAAHAGVLASAGVKSVHVYRRPQVALISSGDELVELDDFTPELFGKRIVSANSVTLASLVESAGAEAIDLGIARDDRASLRAKLEAARGCDLIVTSAGISVGDHDHVRDAVSEVGSIDFWKVRMRPGAPLAFGWIAGIPWIGMSGNPVSAMVTFEVFVRPVIRRMLGHRRLFAETIPVRLGSSVKLAAPLMHFLRAVITKAANGEHVAELAGSQSSSVITAMARANALLILSGDKLEAAAGEVFRALPLGDSLVLSETLELT